MLSSAGTKPLVNIMARMSPMEKVQNKKWTRKEFWRKTLESLPSWMNGLEKLKHKTALSNEAKKSKFKVFCLERGGIAIIFFGRDQIGLRKQTHENKIPQWTQAINVSRRYCACINLEIMIALENEMRQDINVWDLEECHWLLRILLCCP